MSAVRKSFSQYDFPVSLRQSMEEVRPAPRTLPGHSSKPPVPPRRPTRARSYQYLSSNDDDYKSPVTWLPKSRDRPIATPRRISLQTSPSIAPDVENSGYTKFHLPVQPTSNHRNTHYPSSSTLTLTELSQSPQLLPSTIETKQGYYGFGEQFTISIGDKLYVNSVKQSDLVVLGDRIGTKYFVPFNSAIRFSILQDVCTFQKVSDMTKRGINLPYVMCTMQRVSCNRGQDILEEGEVLVLKELQQSGRQTSLVCYSLLSHKEIQLESNCRGPFTTNPENTTMYISDIFLHLSHLLPRNVRLYPPADSSLSPGMVYTLIEQTTLPSLVVSNVGASSDEMFDILLDDNLSSLKVALCKKVPPIKPRTRGHYTKLISGNRLQQSLYSTVCRGHDNTEFTMTAEKEKIYDQALQSVSFSSVAVKQLAPTLSPPHHLPSTSHNSLPRQFPPPQMQQHKFHLPESELRRERYTMTQLSNPPAIYATSLPLLPPLTSTSLPSPSNLNPPPGKSTPYVDLYPPSSVTTSPRSSPFSVTPETKQSNKKFLQIMTEEEIQQLLMTMNMSQYQARFASEGIAGDILIELDEGDLQNELGMKSKVHRVRLMKIIEGHHSAKKILEGESPYEL